MELLEAMGIMAIEAPSEAEAQAAYMAKKGIVYASASQDYDSLLFGAPKLIQNLTLARKRKTVSGFVYITPEMIELDHVLNSLQINLDQLICLGILSGTDYNYNIDGSKNAPTLYKTLSHFKKYHKDKSNLDFYDWLIEKTNYITDYDILQKIHNMFDINKSVNELRDEVIKIQPDKEKVEKIQIDIDKQEQVLQKITAANLEQEKLTKELEKKQEELEKNFARSSNSFNSDVSNVDMFKNSSTCG